jgi:hypothetical protein
VQRNFFISRFIIICFKRRWRFFCTYVHFFICGWNLNLKFIDLVICGDIENFHKKLNFIFQ